VSAVKGKRSGWRYCPLPKCGRPVCRALTLARGRSGRLTQDPATVEIELAREAVVRRDDELGHDVAFCSRGHLASAVIL
jgi:hypothetical protein